MANIVQYGFRPAAGQNNLRVLRFYCDGTNNSTAIFVGDVVKNHSNGGVVASTAAAGTTQVGVVVGIFDTNMIPVGHPSSAVSTKYLTASVVGYVEVALAFDDAFFVAQSAGTSYAITDLWAGVNLVATAGSTTTAHSNHNLGATGGTDIRLVGVINNGQNAVGSANCDMLVQFMSSTWSQIAPSGGV